MLACLDPLLNFGCPHCGASLRFRRVRPVGPHSEQPGPTPRSCPVCQGGVVERRHPALANSWRWSLFYLPGVALCALGIYVPSLGWLLPYAMAALALGLVALVGYMVAARWGWRCYGVYPEAA